MVNDGDRKPTLSASSAGPSGQRGWTVARRLWLGVGTMAAVLTISGLISYWLVRRVEIDLFRITQVEEPLEEAVLEMEINAGKTAQTVLHHLWTPEHRDIDRMHDAERNFERFMKEFEQLAETDQQRALGRKVAGIYRDFKRLGDEIVSMSDRRKVDIEIFRRDVEEIDALIDEKLQPAIDRTSAEGLTKIEAALDMEVSIGEAFAAIDSYLLEPGRAFLEKIADSEAEFQRHKAQYRGTHLSADEEKWLTQIDKNFAEVVKMGGEIVALTDQLHEKLARFEAGLNEIDTILDEKIHPLIDAETQRAANDAHRSAQTLTTLTTVMGLLGLILVTGVTWNVTRNVVRSIRRLTAGVDRFGRGDFDHRIQITGRDELNRLAVTLNEMARDRKQAGEALRDSELRSRTLLESSPVCNKIIGLDFQLQYMSVAGQKRLKIPDITPFYGRTYPLDFYPDWTRTLLIEHLERAKAGEISSVECPVLDMEGSEVWYHTTFVPACDDEGRIEYIIASSVDVTERKQAEEALRETQENLLNRQRREKELVEAELAKTRNELVNSTRLATLGQLTAVVSHEIRNPLGTIRTAVHSVAEEVRGQVPLVDRALDRAVRNIRRCDQIIEQLLDYTRTKESNPVATDVDQWLGIVLDEQDFPERISVTRRLAAGVELPLDREQLRRSVVNVLTNACQTMAAIEDGADARLTIETATEDDRMLIHVRDTGCGIEKEVMDRIFEPFYTTKGFGVGLGLPMVDQLMRQLGGGVSIESEPGQGTTATLWLPLPPEKEP